MIFKVVRPKDTVFLALCKYKGTNEYSFVNITKGHICSCKFNSIEEAIADIESQKMCGLVLSYTEINQSEFEKEENK